MACGAAACSSALSDDTSFQDAARPRARPELWAWLHAFARRYARRRQRMALSELNDHRLRDIGVSREAARREADKRFWR